MAMLMLLLSVSIYVVNSTDQPTHAPTDEGYFWGPRIPKQECYSYNYQHDGDRLDNPVFGSETGLTLDECKTKCATTVDEYNRTCVAIEWKDGGEEQLANYTAKCILAWACDYTEDFGGNSVFMRLGIEPTSSSTMEPTRSPTMEPTKEPSIEFDLAIYSTIDELTGSPSTAPAVTESRSGAPCFVPNVFWIILIMYIMALV